MGCDRNVLSVVERPGRECAEHRIGGVMFNTHLFAQ